MKTRIRRLLGALVWTPALVWAGSGQGLSAGPDVSLEPEIRCWAHGEHSTVFAAVLPDAPIARIYFRCSLHQDYYFTDLEPIGDRYTAILPQATEDCPSVYYYVEAVSDDFTSGRTRERVAEVSEASECRRVDPLVALFAGDPRIILGATSALAPQMAPGFSAAGVVGFISAAGTSSAGAGLGAAAIAGIGGAAAAGAVLVTANGSEETTPEVVEPPAPIAGPPVAGPPAPAPAAPPPSPGGGDTTPLACVSTQPNPAVIGTGEPIRLDASCSRPDRVGDTGDRIAEYIWDFSDGRQKMGRVINAVFRAPGSYQVTLTVVDAGTSARAQQDTETIDITVEDRVEACFTTTDIDPGTGCKLKMDASCSQGDIVRYDWNISDTYGNYNFNGRSITTDFVSCPMPATIRLTVTSEGGESDSVARPVLVNYQRSDNGPRRAVVVVSVEATEESSSARLVSDDGQTHNLLSASPQRLQLTTRAGTNRLAVYPVGPGGATGLVTLDFTSTHGFVPGSLRVLEGDIVSLGSHRVVLRLVAPVRIEYGVD